MKIAEQEQILSYIAELIIHADKEFLKQADNKRKLIEKLSNELFFVGAYTRADLNSHVIPFMEEKAEAIYSTKELALKKSVVLKKAAVMVEVPLTVKPAALKKSDAKLWTEVDLKTLKKEYPKTDTQRLAKKLKRTLKAVRFQARKYRLKKTRSYMQSLYKAASKPATKNATK